MSANTTYECGHTYCTPKRKSVAQMLNEEYKKQIIKIFEEEQQ